MENLFYYYYNYIIGIKFLKVLMIFSLFPLIYGRFYILFKMIVFRFLFSFWVFFYCFSLLWFVSVSLLPELCCSRACSSWILLPGRNMIILKTLICGGFLDFLLFFLYIVGFVYLFGWKKGLFYHGFGTFVWFFEILLYHLDSCFFLWGLRRLIERER